MTERQWRRSETIDYMVAWLRHSHWPMATANRKLRLFACACCRRNWRRLSQRTRQAVELAERYADGQALARELKAMQAALRGNAYSIQAAHQACAANAELTSAVKLVALYSQLVIARDALDAGQTDHNPACQAEQVCQAELLREIAGNPFRPVTIDVAWRRWHDATIPRLAQQMYDSRDFANMSMLADALEEAGCTNADVLEHCLRPGPHVRGCWVVDLVLEKE